MIDNRSHRLVALASAFLMAVTLVGCSGTDALPDTIGEPGSQLPPSEQPPIEQPPGEQPPPANMPDPSWANVMDFGAVGDGVADDSAAFQAATDTGKTVWVPRPPAFYKVTRPTHLRGSIIGDTSDLEDMPLIRMYGSNGDGYHTTLIVRGYRGAEQLVIAGLQIDNQYVNTTHGGEWDHNITISDSENVRVTTNRLLNAWGDGVCIGEWKRAPSSPELDTTNILVDNNFIYNPFRCTVAPLHTSWGTVIRNNYHRKINRSDNGTYIPVIDIEPDAGPQNAVAWDVLIEDNVVDARTSDGSKVHFIWQITGYSYASEPIRGTRVRNNRGNWANPLVPQGPPLAENTNNVYMDTPPSWQMQPLSL
jgi:hypothetical protein